MTAADAFSDLLGRPATEEERARLHRIQTALKLADNDALWSVLVALEYYDSLYREYPRKISEELRHAADAFESVQHARSGPDRSHGAPVECCRRAPVATAWLLGALLGYQIVSVRRTASWTFAAARAADRFSRVA